MKSTMDDIAMHVGKGATVRPLNKERWTMETFTRMPQVVVSGDIGGIIFSELTSDDTAV